MSANDPKRTWPRAFPFTDQLKQANSGSMCRFAIFAGTYFGTYIDRRPLLECHFERTAMDRKSARQVRPQSMRATTPIVLSVAQRKAQNM
jgi:hypothetical protein